jgi:hypothetical protein
VYESSMHGGWAEAPNGKMYTAIPNVGLYEISPGGTWFVHTLAFVFLSSFFTLLASAETTAPP